MKLQFTLLIIITVLSFTTVAQQLNYQKSIDSLQTLKNQYENKIQQIDVELALLRKKVTLQSINNPDNLNISIVLEQEAKVRENTTPLGGHIVLPKGSEVTLLEFAGTYWKVNYGNEVGYISDLYFENNKEIKRIKEEIEVNKKLAELNKNKKEQIEAEKQRVLEEKRKKLDEEKENKRFETAKSSRSPAYFVAAGVTFNEIGNPEATVYLKNISSNTIDAYTVGIYCYNRFGNAVNHYTYNTNRCGGLSQNTINPDDTDYSIWTLYGHENTAKIKVVLEKVHFTNGKTWYPKGKAISIEGVSDN